MRAMGSSRTNVAADGRAASFVRRRRNSLPILCVQKKNFFLGYKKNAYLHVGCSYRCHFGTSYDPERSVIETRRMSSVYPNKFRPMAKRQELSSSMEIGNLQNAYRIFKLLKDSEPRCKGLTAACCSHGLFLGNMDHAEDTIQKAYRGQYSEVVEYWFGELRRCVTEDVEKDMHSDSLKHVVFKHVEKLVKVDDSDVSNVVRTKWEAVVFTIVAESASKLGYPHTAHMDEAAYDAWLLYFEAVSDAAH